MAQAQLDAHDVVTSPEKYADNLPLRQLAWTILMQARGFRVNALRLQLLQRGVA